MTKTTRSQPPLKELSIESSDGQLSTYKNPRSFVFDYPSSYRRMVCANNTLVDPTVCSSCLSGSYRYSICNKMKWSTLSICTALLIILVYLSSGLYALVDLTTMISSQTRNSDNYSILWLSVSSSSSFMTTLGSMSVLVYFTIVIFSTVLLCGIQLGKPWLLLTWSLIMIVMLLADGVVTVLSLRQYQQKNDPSIKSVRVHLLIMIIRLVFSLCAIFVTLFHFRDLMKAKSEQMNRQRMLERFNSNDYSSPSYYNSWTRSATFLNPSKDSHDEYYISDIAQPLSLPRAKFTSIQRHSTSTMINAHNQQPNYATQSHHHAIKNYADIFRYNSSSQGKFHQQETNDVHDFQK